MKFLASFAFTAQVLPRGSRKPRRDVLFSTAEFEIPDLSPSDLVHDAVSVTAARNMDGTAERVSFAGYDASLWSPLRVRPTYAGPYKSDVRNFLKTCLSTYPANPRNDNPLSDAFDEIYSPRDLPPRDNVLERNHEDRYDGKVLDVSSRTAAIERYRTKARDLIRVDDDIYVRRPEPCWETENATAPVLSLRVRPTWLEHAHRFRLDRLDDAQAWIRSRYRGQFPVSGEIHHLDPTFLARDDLSHFLTGHLRPLIEKSTDYLPYLDSSAVMAWHRLAQTKDQTGYRRDAAFPAPLDAALVDLHRLCDALTAARLPGSYLTSHEDLLRDTLTPLRRRIDFESARRPRPALDVVDEDAVSRLGAS
jgi:hypothetical protein